MMGITELAPAKLNLTLDVGARRPDGYHDITSIMQSAALYDVVALDFSEAGGIAIECPGTDRPRQPGLESGGCLFPGDEYPPRRDFYPIGEKNPLPGRSWRRQQRRSRRAAGNASFVSRRCIR